MNVAPISSSSAACNTALHASNMEQPTATSQSTSRTARDPAAIKKAASQFEAIILRQLLAPSIEPMMSGGLGGGQSLGGGVYGYLLTDTLASSLAQGGGLGLARILEKQLTPRESVTDETPDRQTTAPSHLQNSSQP